MILPIPTVLQDDSHSCGSCCLRAVYRYMSRRINAPKASPIDGIDPRKIEQELRDNGFKVTAGEMTVDELRFHSRAERPVIVLTQLNEIGHWQVCKGVSRGIVHLMDPAGQIEREPVASFVERWFDRYHDGASYQNWGIVCGW